MITRRRITLMAVVAALAGATVSPVQAYRPPGHTILASVPDPSSGFEHDPKGEVSLGSTISDDGTAVAFVSSVPTLVPNDTNNVPDIFVRDLQTNRTERVSVASDGTEANDWSALLFILWDAPSISGDGRYVAFMSDATNLVPNDTNGYSDVFVHDRHTGETEIVSVSSTGEIGNFTTQSSEITPDGRFVVMESAASNLVPNDTNGSMDVFVHDRHTGLTELVSVASDGTQANHECRQPVISADGRFVAFTSEATNLVPGDTNGTVHANAGRDVFVHDRVTRETKRVSVATDGTQGNSFSQYPAISDDGSRIAFASLAANLVPNDQNGSMDVFVRDLAGGTTKRVSVGWDGSEAAPVSNIEPVISGDGRWIAYTTSADDSVEGDTNGFEDVHVADLDAGTVEQVSIADDGTPPNLFSYEPSLSGDGRVVSFTSEASNLVPGDDTDCGISCRDVFVHDRGPHLGVSDVVREDLDPGHVRVAGGVRLPAVVAGEATDPAADGTGAAASLGTELVGASALLRPESEDVLLRLDLARMPGFRPEVNVWFGVPPDPRFIWCPACALAGVSGIPGVEYGFRFASGGAEWEVRAMRGPGTADDPAVSFQLYDCSETCTPAGGLTGGFGTRGDTVEIRVPLSLLPSVLEGVRAFARPIDANVDATDVVDLGDVALPAAALEGGSGATPSEVGSWNTIDLQDGRFDATLAVPSEGKVWLRLCLGSRCSAKAA